MIGVVILALANAPPNLAVALHVRVAVCEGAPVRSEEWVDEHVAAVRALLAPHGITVSATRETFTPPRCELLDAADRDALAESVPTSGAVTVLVMPRVRDLAVPTYDLRGVHWRARGRRWIFLTARAQPPVLAHELCHDFGLPHDPAGGNLMAPGPSSPLWRRTPRPQPFAPILTAAQVARLRRGILGR
jgi:hypothetical protein